LKLICPIREIAEERVNRIQEATKVGEKIEGVVIDFDRRNLVVSISVKRMLESERKEAYQSYLDKQESQTSQRMTLGDALKGQLKAPEPIGDDGDA
jgi:ribosomal protein S1